MSSKRKPLVLYLPSNFELVHEKCRVCLGTKENMLSITDTIEIDEEQVRLEDVLRACTVIKVEYNDNKPKLICHECKNKAVISYKFKTACEKTDKKLEICKINKTECSLRNKNNKFENRTAPPANSTSFTNSIDQRNQLLASNNSHSMKESISDEEEFFFEGEFETVVVKEEPVNHDDYTNNDEYMNNDEYGSQDEYTNKDENINNDENINTVEYVSGNEEDTLSSVGIINNDDYTSNDLYDTITNENNVVMEDSTPKNEFTCALCEEYFESKYGLMTHLNEVHIIPNEVEETEEYEEIIIQNDFEENESNFEITLSSGKKKNYKCFYCGKVFGRKFNLIRHLKSAKSCPAYEENDMAADEEVKVKNEDEDFENDPTFQEMLASIKRVNRPMVSTSIAGYGCPACKKMFVRRFNVIRHLKTTKCYLSKLKVESDEEISVGNMGKEIDPDDVEKLIASIKIIKHAKVAKHTSNCYSCPLCGKGFQRRFNVVRHLKTTKCFTSQNDDKNVSVEDSEIFLCDICQKGFNQEDGLLQHIRIQHSIKDDLHGDLQKVVYPESSLHCRYCNFIGPNKDKLWRHMSYEHEDLKTVQCQKCPKKFFEEKRLKDHMSVHDKQKSHVCNFCGAAFLHSFNLKSHIRIHTGEKPYKCDVCKLAFGQYNSLKSHRLTVHDLNYNYVCDLCGSAFKRLQEFRVHNMRHQKHRPYTCEHCNNSFVTSYELKVHSDLHLNNKIFCCGICNKKFRCKNTYEAHIMLAHNYSADCSD